MVVKTAPQIVGTDSSAQRQIALDMRAACGHACDMSRMIQIRNVPDALHRKIKARAAQSGMTLSDYLLAEIERIAALPTRDEMLARLHARTRVNLKTPAAEMIRRERESA
jgi:plasmid stability protein